MPEEWLPVRDVTPKLRHINLIRTPQGRVENQLLPPVDPNEQQGTRNPALCLTHILSILLGVFLNFIVCVNDVCVSEV